MAKRWKPIGSTKRDWLMTVLIGGTVIWFAGLTGLLLSSYLFR